MNSTQRLVSVGRKKYIIVDYEFMKTPKEIFLQNSLMGFCCSALHKKELDTLDRINAKQYYYYNFICEAYLDIKRAKGLKGVDKICFSENSKDIIARFDKNIHRLKRHANRCTMFCVGNLRFSWLEGVAYAFILVIIALTLSMLFLNGKELLKAQDIRNISLRLARVEHRRIVSINLAGETRYSDRLPKTSFVPAFIYVVSNITQLVTKPSFDPTITLFAFFATICAIMLITALFTGIFNTKDAILKKIDKIPDLYGDARSYFSHLDIAGDIEYKGVRYFTYDIKKRSKRK